MTAGDTEAMWRKLRTALNQACLAAMTLTTTADWPEHAGSFTQLGKPGPGGCCWETAAKPAARSTAWSLLRRLLSIPRAITRWRPESVDSEKMGMNSLAQSIRIRIVNFEYVLVRDDSRGCRVVHSRDTERLASVTHDQPFLVPCATSHYIVNFKIEGCVKPLGFSTHEENLLPSFSQRDCMSIEVGTRRSRISLSPGGNVARSRIGTIKVEHHVYVSIAALGRVIEEGAAQRCSSAHRYGADIQDPDALVAVVLGDDLY